LFPTDLRFFIPSPATNIYRPPKLVGQFEFVEWTDVNHLRHTKFIALRDDKKAKDVVMEE
jgi:ATP-dependent DNA ligase